MTNYKSQVGRDNFTIYFETDKRWIYRKVEACIRHCRDIERVYHDGLIGTKGDILIFDEGSDNE